MKGILEFNLTDPDEAEQFKLAVHAQEMKSVLWDLDQWLRNKIKYSDFPEEVIDALQNTRDELYSLLQDESINLD